MILITVIVGYILGVMSFIIPKLLEKLLERREKQIKVKENEAEYKSQEEILDEWLNGPKQTGVNQEDICNEYVTGQVTKKGD